MVSGVTTVRETEAHEIMAAEPTMEMATTHHLASWANRSRPCWTWGSR
jgi:predicted phosphoribosyltransferase